MSTQEQYRVDVRRMDVDFIQFEQSIEELSETEYDAAGPELEKRYAGELFEDKAYIWAIDERERLGIVYVSFAKSLVHRLIARKQYREAAHTARRLVARNEFDEESNLLLLRVLGAMGDRQSLHSSYERYSQLLLRELGLRPSEELCRIYEQYRATGVTQE
ncbi:AfsR/SARP family transcriptional regulator [Cohnella hongkongensis]|uniref:BTAD domain-containing putative transcriptional regulator n=1 Tax=Cohnella hongkongensis TaxID=178337 RepID=A0ABV9FMH8_9BACL